MAGELVRKFIDALHQLEQTEDMEPMARLFAEEATLSNVAGARHFDGPEGARAFWRAYRHNFGEVHSEFRRIIDTPEGAALEWESEGTTHGGHSFRYSGVTLLDFRDGQVTRFHSYFDPGKLGAQLEPAQSPRQRPPVEYDWAQSTPEGP